MTTSTATRPTITVRTRKPRKPEARSIRLESFGRVIITMGKKETLYFVIEFPVPCREDETPGRGFRCKKAGCGEVYDIFLAMNGQDDTCDCMGFTAHGHCKHRDGLKALMSRGMLDTLPATQA